MPLFLYFCYWWSRDIKANTLLSFEKDCSLYFGINILTQLLFKFFASITNVWHFSWAPQDHGHKACSWADEGALVYWHETRNVGQGSARASMSPFSLVSFSADYLKWPTTVGGTETNSLMACLLDTFIIYVSEGILLRVPWTAWRSHLSILKEINLEYLLEGPMLKLKLQ